MEFYILYSDKGLEAVTWLEVAAEWLAKDHPGWEVAPVYSANYKAAQGLFNAINKTVKPLKSPEA